MKTVTGWFWLTLILFSGVVSAQQSLSTQGDVTVGVVDGVLKVELSGKGIFEKQIGNKETAAVVKTGKNAAGDMLFSVLVKGTPDHRIIGVIKGNAVQIVWDNALIATGDPGEETSVDVRVMDLDRDGSDEVVRGTTYGAVRLCGQQQAPLLFREVYDFRKKKFVPASGKRSLSPRESLLPAIDFTAKLLQGVSFLTPDSVSSSKGDDRNPLLLTPPYTLVDDLQPTGWQVGTDDGYGEFVTFLTLSNRWKITAVSLDTATVSKGTSKGDRFASPASVVVAFENVAYRLILPESTGRHWFELPQPVSSSCMSVVLEKSAGQRGVPMSLFEVRVQTELHQSGGLTKLAKLLDDDDMGEASLQILLRVGNGAYEAVKSSWKQLSPAGKRRAVRFLSEMAPVQGASLLVSYGVTDGRYVHDILVSGLKNSRGNGEVVLGRYLTNKSETKADAARQLLVELGSDAAFEVLLALLPNVHEERRQVLLSSIAELATHGSARLLILMKMAEVAWDNKNLDSMFELLEICAPRTVSAEPAARLAHKVFDESGFENKYRSLRIIATSRMPVFIPFLIDVANGENEYLRRLATRALGEFRTDASARNAVIGLAQDHSPGVQMEAMNSLLNFSSDIKKSALMHGMESPWPQVRALSVKNATDVPSVQEQLVSRGLTDDRYMVVTEALALAAQVGRQSLDSAINDILVQSKNAKLLVQAAHVVGERCQGSRVTLDALAALLRMGAEPLATSPEKLVGVAAAEALGQIGAPAAIAHLKTARKRSNLVTDKAIDAALINAKNGCAKGTEGSGD